MSRIISTLLLGIVLTMVARPALAEAGEQRVWYWRDACGSCPSRCAPEFYMCPCFRYTAEDFEL